MKTNIGLSEKDSFGSAERLNKLLSDLFVLYVRTRHYHWNVTGMHFRSLHSFFEELYGQLDEELDQVAERVRHLGSFALGSLEQYKKLARLQELPGDVPSGRGMLHQLLTDHETLIRHLREDIQTVQDHYHDAGTADFLTGLLEAHEKTAWMLRAYLEPEQD